MARNATITATIANHRLTLTFANDKTITIDGRELHSAIAAQALMHGLKQKLVDAAAISRNTETGKAASVEDKYNAVKAVYDRLIAGEWNAAREGGGTGGLLLQALARHYGGRKTIEQLREWLEAQTPAQKTALRANPKIAVHIEAIRAETGKAANIDTDALLAGLDEEDDAGDEESV